MSDNSRGFRVHICSYPLRSYVDEKKNLHAFTRELPISLSLLNQRLIIPVKNGVPVPRGPICKLLPLLTPEI